MFHQVMHWRPGQDHIRWSKPLEQRLMEKVEMIPVTGCWIFTGSLDCSGTGRISPGKGVSHRAAHEILYELRVGPLPEGRGLKSTCGVSSCIALEHRLLFDNSPKSVGLKGLLSQYRAGAEDRGKSFELTADEFAFLVFQNCIYCGKAPKYRKGVALCVNGIDQIDSAKGYIVGNVAPCCYICNRMKGTLSRGDFLGQAFKISRKFSRSVKHHGR